ncbi:MAG TPA: FAD-dependent oxidoreductase [Trueperaceae bacterium]
MSIAANEDLPIAVLGAGPVGLAAAAHLHARGLRALVLEAGGVVGSSVREWGHVRLFSPWRYLVDPAAKSLLESHGWRPPDPDAHPTGAELVTGYLKPLAATPEIGPMLRFGHRVTAVTRVGYDRLKTGGRERAPFLVVAEAPQGQVRLKVRSVIDATGTWMTPNPLGAGGVHAAGEAENAGHVRYGVPDVLGCERERYAARRTLVVGSGHSAFNAVIDLAALAEEVPGTQVLWAVRRREPGQMFGGGDDDALPERGALGERARALVARRGVELLPGFFVDRLDQTEDGLAVVAADGRRLVIDEVVAATGFRPDLEMTRELRLDLDPITEAPVRLAPLIDPNVHSCGTVPPHGEAELAHPEPGYYAVGMKSYGRAPTFLMLTGYEQVRSVVAFLAGDVAAARRVELVLPETGVCSSNLPGTDAACCGPQIAADASGSEDRHEHEIPVLAGGCCG